MSEPSVLAPLTIRELLDARRKADPEHIYCRSGEGRLSIGSLWSTANRFANGLLSVGVKPGDRVAVMLPNDFDYVTAFLAMARIGVCQVPININLKGSSLEYIIEHSALRGIITDVRFMEQLAPVLRPENAPLVIVRGVPIGTGPRPFHEIVARGLNLPPPVTTTQEDTLLISYTSGTTGVPKGVLVSDKMLQAAGWAAARLAETRPGDTLYFWEPIYHIAGCEVLILALLEPVTLALAERFRLSRFWPEVRETGSTHIHYFGGVLPLLCKEPPSPLDREHKVRIAWGGGCPLQFWRPFEERFGIRVRECYGMTEASSFTTLNTEERLGSIVTSK
jgi:carnitine-CoA ligase